MLSLLWFLWALNGLAQCVHLGHLLVSAPSEDVYSNPFVGLQFLSALLASQLLFVSITSVLILLGQVVIHGMRGTATGGAMGESRPEWVKAIANEWPLGRPLLFLVI